MEQFDALSMDAFRMLMAGVPDKEIARRLNYEDVIDLLGRGEQMAFLYDYDTLPTTLSPAGLVELAALEQERFPMQQQWNKQWNKAAGPESHPEHHNEEAVR